MKKNPSEKVNFRQGVVAGVGILSINLSTVTKLVTPQTLSLLEVFPGDRKSVVGAMKIGGEKSLEALDELRCAIDERNVLLSRFKRIGYTLSAAVPEEVEGEKMEFVIVDDGRVRISFPSMRGVPVVEKLKNGRKVFSIPSFWRIEIDLNRMRCLVRFQIYGCYSGNGQWFGVWKPKISSKSGPVIKTVQINSERDLHEVVRQTGVSKSTLASRLAQAKRLLNV